MFVERENIIPRKRIPVGKREKPSVSKAYSPYDYNSINEGFSLLKYYLRMFNDNENKLYAGVVKLVDTSDLSSDAQCMRVRFPPPVPRNPPRVLCSGRVLLCFAVFVSINCCVVNLCCFLLPQFCPLTAPKDALHICPSYPAASCGDGGREIRCWATIKSHDSFKGKTVEFA